MRISDWSSDVCSSDLRSTLSLLWTLHAVRDRGQNAFTYAGPTWFWYEDRERGPDAEADLLMVVDGTSIVAEVKSSWAVMRKSDVTALGDIAKKIRPDVALLAVMDTGKKHREALEALGSELREAGIKLQVDRKSTRMHYSHYCPSRLPSSA